MKQYSEIKIWIDDDTRFLLELTGSIINRSRFIYGEDSSTCLSLGIELITKRYREAIAKESESIGVSRESVIR